MIKEAVILAGGKATRLYPMTHNFPKAMIEVAGEPFIAHQLRMLKNNGVRRAVICIAYLGGKIKDFLGDGRGFGVKIEYSSDADPMLGTGGAVKKALPLLGNAFFLLYGDSYLPIDFRAVGNYFLSRDKLALVTIIKNNNRWDKSNILYKNGRIEKYDKKSHPGAAEYIDYGLSVFRKEAFLLEGLGEAFELDLLFRKLIKAGELLAYKTGKRFFEIGSMRGLEETRKYFRKILK